MLKIFLRIYGKILPLFLPKIIALCLYFAKQYKVVIFFILLYRRIQFFCDRSENVVFIFTFSYVFFFMEIENYHNNEATHSGKKVGTLNKIFTKIKLQSLQRIKSLFISLRNSCQLYFNYLN